MEKEGKKESHCIAGEEELIAAGIAYVRNRLTKVLREQGYVPPVQWTERTPAYLRQVLIDETVMNNGVPPKTDINQILISLASLDDESVVRLFSYCDQGGTG